MKQTSPYFAGDVLENLSLHFSDQVLAPGRQFTAATTDCPSLMCGVQEEEKITNTIRTHCPGTVNTCLLSITDIHPIDLVIHRATLLTLKQTYHDITIEESPIDNHNNVSVYS